MNDIITISGIDSLTQALDETGGYESLVRGYLRERFPEPPLAYVHSYGCQQNVADGEKLKGMLLSMGYGLTDGPELASLILYNTCAVRAHAEDRVFGNVGALKHYKRRNKNLIIALCGCMMQQPAVRDKIKCSFPYVDLVFGTHVLPRLPELIYRALTSGARVFETPEQQGDIPEGIPVSRDHPYKAFIPIMYGCNNFCSFCVVPHVRGRERSRRPERIVDEVRGLAARGYREFMLLGQNVNSYGKTLDEPYPFAQLLRDVNTVEGDFRVRFMTSHPRDLSPDMIDAIAQSDKICNQLHLPVQSGNDRMLKLMNRHYDAARYRELVAMAKERIPGLSLSSDIIVGFPSETDDEFEDTLRMVEHVRYDHLYTFIYSRRDNTKAATMDDPFTHKQKVARFERLLALQNDITAGNLRALVGTTQRVLCEGPGKTKDGTLAGKTEGGVTVEFDGPPALESQFCDVQIVDTLPSILLGRME